MNAQQAWTAAFGQLELQLDRASFDTWLRGASFITEEDGVFVIGVRNSYARDMLQHRLYRNVRRVLSDVCGNDVEVRFEVHRPQPAAAAAGRGGNGTSGDMPLFQFLAERSTSEAVTAIEEEATTRPLHEQIRRPQRPGLPESELNPRYTFDRFLVYSGNRLAYEAARAVVEHPGRGYNPFLIYGGVGTGKTHLLQAIAHSFQARGQTIIYVPSEAFTNDLIDAIRHKSTAMFRDRYRSADVLLVDDIQFIAGKESTQEEFFHTFNALSTFNKQIVLASDRHPSELHTLEDRLRSRFQGGLLTDVNPPDFESRLAILSMWAAERAVEIPDNVLQMVAERARNNVRELHGMFNQIVIKAQFTRHSVTVDSAASSLKRYEPQTGPDGDCRVTLPQLIEAVATHYQIPPRDLTGKKRSGRLNQARQVGMYLARDLTDESLAQIGAAFGGRSHTTVLHGCNKMSDEMEQDPSLAGRVRRIRSALGIS